MKRMTPMIALLLMFSILTTNVFAGILPQRPHSEMTISEMEALTFDEEAFNTLCADIQAAAETEAEDDSLAEMLAELREQYLIQDTLLTLAGIRSDQNVLDRDADETYMDLLDRYYRVEDLMSQTILAVLYGPNEDLIDQDDMVMSMYLWDYEPMTDEEKELYYEEVDLIDQYQAAAADPYTAEISGGNYTEPELYEAYLEDRISWEDYDSGALAIAISENEALAPIYLELVKNRRAQAELYEFDDYAAMQDEYYYYRDFDAGDIEKFAQYVKTWIVPLANTLYERIEDAMYDGAFGTVLTEEELLTHLRAGLPTVSDELLPALDYMERTESYDIAWTEEKAYGAYTTILPYTGTPFLLMEPENSDYDFTTIVHEFGHYNAFYCSEDYYVTNIDLSEIHSQGLELLMLDYYDQVFGEDGDAERMYTLYQILSSMVDGCMMDELERWAYAQEDLTVETMNQKYMELLKTYGYRDENDPETQAYGWVEIAHLFSQPVYYISYAVSASAALELWRMARTDRDGAIEVYLELVACGELNDFQWTLNHVGLADPLTERSVQDIATAVSLATDPNLQEEPEGPSDELQPQEQAEQGSEETEEPEAAQDTAGRDRHARRLLILEGALLGAAVVLLAVVIAGVVRMRRRKRQ